MWFKNAYRRHNERKLKQAEEELAKWRQICDASGAGTVNGTKGAGISGTANLTKGTSGTADFTKAGITANTTGTAGSGTAGTTTATAMGTATAGATTRRGLGHAKSFFEYIKGPAEPEVEADLSTASGPQFAVGEIDAEPMELQEPILPCESTYLTATDTVLLQDVQAMFDAVNANANAKPMPMPMRDVTNEPRKPLRPKMSAVRFHQPQSQAHGQGVAHK